MDDARYYWLALSTIRGLGGKRMKNLLQYYGDPVSIWQANRKELEEVLSSPVLAGKITAKRGNVNLDCLIRNLEKNKISFLCLYEENYPENLKNISDPPPVIYYKGEPDFSFPAVAIVGARGCSEYGKKVAGKIAYELSERGITVISGLARGI